MLVVAYYFPPMGLSGVQRTLKFVKYLPEFGWEPTVLTVTPTGYFAQDYGLLDEISGRKVEVERVGSLDPNRLFQKKGIVKMPSERMRKVLSFASDLFFIPDNKVLWKRKAVRAAERLFERKKFDIIFATGPPFTDFLIGLELHRAWRRPLVLDYRDPWLEYPFKYYPTPFHKIITARQEKRALHAASRIVTTNRRVKELILNRHAFLNYDDVVILPQGFDPADFQNGAGAPQARGVMRITHAGVFYGDRTPKYFLQALRKVLSEHPEMKGHIESCLIGNLHEEHLRLVGSSRVDLQACKLEYSIVSPK